MESFVIGQYIKGNSWIYRIDPRVKIISLVLLIVITFLMPNLISIGCLLLGLTVLIITTRIPLLKMLSGLKTLLFLLAFTFVIQISSERDGVLLLSLPMNFGLITLLISIALFLIWLFTQKWVPFRFLYLLGMVILAFVGQYFITKGIIFSSYNIEIFSSGLEKASYVFLRIVIVVLLSSMLTFSTSSTDLNNGLESVMKPLKFIHVPVSEISMMISLTLRFIPTLLSETNKIMKAQASRGVDFNESKLHEKIMQVISLLIPMFVISFQRAEDLANAMEARGYVIGAKRTKIDEMKIRFLDIATLVIVNTGLIILIFINVIA